MRGALLASTANGAVEAELVLLAGPAGTALRVTGPCRDLLVQLVCAYVYRPCVGGTTVKPCLKACETVMNVCPVASVSLVASDSRFASIAPALACAVDGVPNEYVNATAAVGRGRSASASFIGSSRVRVATAFSSPRTVACFDAFDTAWLGGDAAPSCTLIAPLVPIGGRVMTAIGWMEAVAVAGCLAAAAAAGWLLVWVLQKMGWKTCKRHKIGPEKQILEQLLK